MVKLAGEIGDGVIFNFFPPARVKEALGELAEGAKIADRDVEQIEPTLFATAFISDDLEAARRPARKLLSRYGALKFYGNMMAHSGFEREISAIRAAGRDADAAIRAVSNELIDADLAGRLGVARSRATAGAMRAGNRHRDRVHQSGQRRSQCRRDANNPRAQAVDQSRSGLVFLIASVLIVAVAGQCDAIEEAPNPFGVDPEIADSVA